MKSRVAKLLEEMEAPVDGNDIGNSNAEAPADLSQPKAMAEAMRKLNEAMGRYLDEEDTASWTAPADKQDDIKNMQGSLTEMADYFDDAEEDTEDDDSEEDSEEDNFEDDSEDDLGESKKGKKKPKKKSKRESKNGPQDFATKKDLESHLKELLGDDDISSLYKNLEKEGYIKSTSRGFTLDLSDLSDADFFKMA